MCLPKSIMSDVRYDIHIHSEQVYDIAEVFYYSIWPGLFVLAIWVQSVNLLVA